MSKEIDTKQMSLLGVSRANRSRSQANKKERVTTDISGLRCFASSKHSNLGSLLARMCQELLTSKTAWSSKLCALTWKVKDTKFNRSIFQLQPSVLHTKEKEFGSLLPTPTTQEIEHPNMKLTKTGRRLTKDGKNSHSLNLADTVKMLPTPKARDYKGAEDKRVIETSTVFSKIRKQSKVKYGASLNDVAEHLEMRMWPTPRTGGGSRPNQKGGKVLNEEVLIAEGLRERGKTLAKNDKEQWIKGGGALNPTWVEWLMGYPAEYTDLEDWAILSSRKSSKK